MNLSQWVEQRERHESKRVGGDSQKEQEGNHGMRPKDDSRHEIGDGEIRRQGDWPAEGQHGFVQDLDDAKMNQCRNNTRAD